RAFGAGDPPLDGLVALASVVRVNGPYADSIRHAMGHAWIASSYAAAANAAPTTPRPVATTDGDVFRRPHLVTGGSRGDGGGILEAKRRIKELRDRAAADRGSLERLTREAADFEATIANASNAIAALNADQHKHEKAIVAFEAQLQHAHDEAQRL